MAEVWDLNTDVGRRAAEAAGFPVPDESTAEGTEANGGKEPSGSPLSEKAFMANVRSFAEAHGWLVYHTHDSRRSESGFPDLTMARNGRLVFAELKTEKGTTTVGQQKWIACLLTANREVYVWRPSDWPEIERILR